MGHNVSVFTTDALEFENDRCKEYTRELAFDDSGVKVFRFHLLNSPFLRILIKYFGILFAGVRRIDISKPEAFLYYDILFNSSRVPKLFLTLAESRDFDVVNGTMCGEGGLFFIEKICRKNKVPFVFTPRSHTLDPFFKKTFPLWLKIANDANAIIVLTEYEKDYYIAKGVDPDKIFVTGIGISANKSQESDPLSFRDQHNIPSNHKIVLHIGRMERYKGAGLIIESMKEVWKKMPETSLVIIGRSQLYTQEIKQITRKERRIVVLPNAPEKVKEKALFCSNVLVNPSQFESFGGVFLEAWAAGKPVIGAKTPVSESVIDEGKNGLLLNALDANELANKIVFLLENENVAEEMGKKGKEKVLNDYTWEKIAQKTLKVYEWVQK
jgi:glycosyltransferase involved in cell wall biosynthesis